MEIIKQNILTVVVILFAIGAIAFSAFNEEELVTTDTKQPVLSEKESVEVIPEPVKAKLVEEKVEVSEPVKIEAKLASYEVVEEEDISYAGCERLAVRVVMEDEATQADAKLTVKTIAEKYSNWDEVTVWGWGYSERSEVGASMFTKGMYEAGSCN